MQMPLKHILTHRIEEYVKQIMEFRKTGKSGDGEFLEKKIVELMEALYGGGEVKEQLMDNSTKEDNIYQQ
jgi:hypothetical protein